MEYEEVRVLKKSEKSAVHLLREKGGERIFVRKTLAGQHPIYKILQDCPHSCLPKLYEVTVSEDSTTVIEEYIEGRASGAAALSEKQFLQVVREMCSVLGFLHGKGIIHRDIKPSNIILTEDGHVCLIDFDAARMPKAELEQDTKLLGTRGFAPPEQYGFSQTDERADIYALGVTLEQLLGDEYQRPRYKKILRKCTSLDPEKRYQSVRQVRQAFFHHRRKAVCSFAGLLLFGLILCGALWLSASRREKQAEGEEAVLTTLPVPGNPHWDGETGIAMWDNVLESGIGDEVQFHLRLYRRDAGNPPDPDDGDWYFEDLVRIGGSYRNLDVQEWNVVTELEGNGMYYFTLSAVGDGIRYADSPYVVSDAFEYTGEEAPPLPTPTGLAWRMFEEDDTRNYCATWSNLDDYGDDDSFNVTFYDETGAYVMNNTWTMSQIKKFGQGGIYIPTEFLKEGPGKAYRFTVQAYSSRPNVYGSSPMPDPVPEEYYSPWLYYGAR